MTDIEDFTVFGLDENLQPLRTSGEKNTQESYFKAVFTPPTPPFDKFHPSRFKYASNETSVVFSAIDDFGARLGILFGMPRDLQSGTYAIDNDNATVGAMLVVGDLAKRAHEGSITFTRDAQKGTIEGTFHFKVLNRDSEYEVAGEFYLVKTGDL